MDAEQFIAFHCPVCDADDESEAKQWCSGVVCRAGGRWLFPSSNTFVITVVNSISFNTILIKHAERGL